MQDHHPVRARGRRTVLVAGALVAAVVVAVVAGVALTTSEDRAAPRPGVPSPRTTPDRTPDDVAGQVVRDGHLVSYAVNAEGVLLTVWQRCVAGGSHCRTAWQLQGRGAVRRALVRGNFAEAVAAGDHFVVTSWNRSGIVLDVNGRSRPLRAVASGRVVPGDALVRSRKSLAVVDPVTATAWPLPAPNGVDGWVEGTITADGTVWATPAVPVPPIDVRVSWLPPRSTHWQRHTISTSFEDGAAPGPVAAARYHVAVASMHDGVDVATYGVFAVTSDAGATWSDLRPPDLPFDNVDAMAATSGGTLFVTSTDGAGRGRVFRSTDATWRHFAEVPAARDVVRLVAAGRRVAAVRGTPGRTEVLALDDAGRARAWATFP